jgi:hypothetical protein
MDLLEKVLPLVGVLFGAGLTGFGALWKERLERRKVVGRALSDLLEVRHQFRSADALVRELQKRITMPEEMIVGMRALGRTVFPMESDAHKRYSESIATLAGFDPVLAFQLRSKDKAPEMLAYLSKFNVNAKTGAADALQLEMLLEQVIGPELDKAVIALASRHSWSSRRQVKALLANVETPKELERMLDDLLVAVSAPGEAAPESAEAASPPVPSNTPS